MAQISPSLPLFSDRHNAISNNDCKEMLVEIGINSLDELINQTIPSDIRLSKPIELPSAESENSYLERLKIISRKNKVNKSYIGWGYYGTHTPNVILRNILENPGWYTQYTPYQAEISQGRLQALLNFQTVVSDLTGFDIANASLLDEGSAAAEAMFMLYSLRTKPESKKILLSKGLFPQTIDVIQTRALPLGIEVVIEYEDTAILSDDFFGAILQYPNKYGEIKHYAEFVKTAQAHNIKVAVAADILSLTLLTPPAEWGADIAFGSTQRLGVPMGFGGPHAAYFATKEIYKRSMPGRIIGVTEDSNGNYALRMALQTREQHIKRDRATSNICTAQALLAIMASMYAVYHGAEGLRNIAQQIHGLTCIVGNGLKKLGFSIENKNHFDTLCIHINDSEKEQLEKLCLNEGINLNYFIDGRVIISLDETSNINDAITLVNLFAQVAKKGILDHEYITSNSLPSFIPTELTRKSSYLTHPVFNTHHSEHEMLRYIKLLESKDLSLCHSMIPLGSCTMKLNASTEMIPVSWSEFANLHPFAPLQQAEGYLEVFKELETWLANITGFDGVSLQPNSGAQGEYAGLIVIKSYLNSIGQGHRKTALIPASAHGTNPASAALVGMTIVVVKCDEKGNIDVEDLKAKAKEHQHDLACLMVTYPSTHGVFEETIIEICNTIHSYGGQVYMDGANMNAQVGLTNPATIGADVCHLNLHKTFAIPHGGGGPGVGPICVAKHLTPFLPGHVIASKQLTMNSAVASAPWGSANVLLIAHAYISLMGENGLTRATKTAILNANYIKARLSNSYPILYAGKNGYCAHEFILDCREFKAVGIEVTDIAKRLMDYGFHAPTVSFPVPGTLMIEPTESEPKAELDRFCDALINIRSEIREIEQGIADTKDNVLKNAPHTAHVLISDSWSKNYSREKAAFPLEYLKQHKFWPSVGRVNDSLGDRNLICSCPPIATYEEALV